MPKNFEKQYSLQLAMNVRDSRVTKFAAGSEAECSNSNKGICSILVLQLGKIFFSMHALKIPISGNIFMCNNALGYIFSYFFVVSSQFVISEPQYVKLMKIDFQKGFVSFSRQWECALGHCFDWAKVHFYPLLTDARREWLTFLLFYMAQKSRFQGMK